jgi:hypothetical protein
MEHHLTSISVNRWSDISHEMSLAIKDVSPKTGAVGTLVNSSSVIQSAIQVTSTQQIMTPKFRCNKDPKNTIRRAKLLLLSILLSISNYILWTVSGVLVQLLLLYESTAGLIRIITLQNDRHLIFLLKPVMDRATLQFNWSNAWTHWSFARLYHPECWCQFPSKEYHILFISYIIHRQH